ncbi:MAG: hypothetical protein FJ308_05670 [Planctomycetes bacterium]|nr:hypothetical protein [Planctomycetota bacterium]
MLLKLGAMVEVILYSTNAIVRIPFLHWPLWIAVVLACSFASQSALAQNEVTLEVIDEKTGEPTAARIEVVKSAKKLNRDRKTLISGDTWLAEGKLVLQPPPGEYEFLAKRGPEFKEIRGGFTIERRAKDVVVIELPRSVDMHDEHWYSGDLGVELERETARRWQIADAVDMVVTNLRGQKREASAGQDAKSKITNANKTGTKNPTAKSPAAKNGMLVPGSIDLIGSRWGSMSLDILAPEIGVAIHRYEQVENAVDSPLGERPDAKDLGWKDAWNVIETFRGDQQALIEITQPGARDTPFLLADPNVKLVRVLSSVNRPKGDDSFTFPRSADSSVFATLSLGASKDRTALLINAPFPYDERIRFKGSRGVGKLNEFLYWQMLEAGLRLAPGAASGFGKGETHIGYNRVYVYCEGPSEEFPRSSGFEKSESRNRAGSRSGRDGSPSYEADTETDNAATKDTGAADSPSVDHWWHGLEHGASFVSNGPLLRAMVNGSPPGSVHPGYRGEAIPLDIAVSLAVREKVDYLDVIFNGETLYNAKLEDHYKRGEFPELSVSESGWLVMRVVTAHEDGYRYASTAPFYFEFEGKPRVSKKSVEFFQGWLERSIEAIDQDDEQRSMYADRKQAARVFWENLQSHATAP